VLSAATTAAALAGAHAGAQASSSSLCEVLPTSSSSPAPGPSPTITPAVASSSSTGTSAVSISSVNTDLCVSVAAEQTSDEAGHPASYTVRVWPTGGPAEDVTVQISVAGSGSTPRLPDPVFDVCGSGEGTQTCKVGPLSENQAIELEAEDFVPSSAKTGDSATLSATATGVASGATSDGTVSATATVNLTTPPKTDSGSSSSGSHSHGSSGSSGSHSGSSGQGSQIGALSNLPPLPGSTTGTGSNGSTGSNTGGLFPTINPSSPSGSSGTSTVSRSPSRSAYHPKTVADVLPLNTGQVSSQVAGLVVLAIGIIIAVARVSLRRPKTAAEKD
jgi:hypothetical protein